ncbi:helix-turn-helix domain-containing protein [Mucilaginibacter paludis]|uniref:Helix-turn-helix domain protein n=1 Tax=Mucilaginibacter paludis DSM 18603 TaxID=714943 RepID=H1YIK1_9SPHI|nr:helix-turn-helix transcriptional regulator [Mucilaginibacter paludis]EHQ26567.1 helix-turn-helix domain protein [Mucilaginibacter paludis DSM 18603]
MSGNKNKIYRIGAVLADKGIDNKVLAELMGVKPETVSRWCNNEIQPKPENLYKIAQLTKTNLQELHISTTDWPSGPSAAELAQTEYDAKQKSERLKNLKNKNKE